MSLLTEVSPSNNTFGSINLYDSSGLIWEIRPIGSDDDDDATLISTRLINYLSLYTPSDAKVIRIVKYGFLMKRGKLNPSFQNRWCVLTSDHKLNYYKFEGGQRQGTISIDSLNFINFPKKKFDLSFTLQEPDRLWTFQTHNETDRNSWMEALTCMMQTLQGRNLQRWSDVQI